MHDVIVRWQIITADRSSLVCMISQAVAPTPLVEVL